MKIKEKLQEIVQYFGVNRQVGHTTTMLHGTLKNDEPVIIIAHNQTGVNHIKNITKKTDKVVSLESLNSSLKGQRSPLVFDNAALHLLLMDSLGEISSLELDVREEKEKMGDLLDAMLKTVNEELAYHDHTKQQRLKYAEEYSYKAIVRDRHSSKEYSNNNEKEALWHDGSRDGHEAAIYSLNKLKRCLDAVKADDNSDKQK
jgi:hypothetical protein